MHESSMCNMRSSNAKIILSATTISCIILNVIFLVLSSIANINSKLEAIWRLLSSKWLWIDLPCNFYNFNLNIYLEIYITLVVDLRMMDKYHPCKFCHNISNLTKSIHDKSILSEYRSLSLLDTMSSVSLFAMNTLFWNTRGRGDPAKCRMVKDVIVSSKASIVCLEESKISDSSKCTLSEISLIRNT